MKQARLYPPGHESDGAAGKDAKFQVMAIDVDFVESVSHQIALGLETQRMGHRPLDILDRPVKRPE